MIGMWVAHFGIAIFMLGAVGDSLFNSEQVVRANPGDVIKIADRNVTFTGTTGSRAKLSSHCRAIGISR